MAIAAITPPPPPPPWWAKPVFDVVAVVVGVGVVFAGMWLHADLAQGGGLVLAGAGVRGLAGWLSS